MAEDGEARSAHVATFEIPRPQGSHIPIRSVCDANLAQSPPRTRCAHPRRDGLVGRRPGSAGPDAIAAARPPLRLVAGVLVVGRAERNSSCEADTAHGSSRRTKPLAFHPAQEFLHDAAIKFGAELLVLDAGVNR